MDRSPRSPLLQGYRLNPRFVVRVALTQKHPPNSTAIFSVFDDFDRDICSESVSAANYESLRFEAAILRNDLYF